MLNSALADVVQEAQEHRHRWKTTVYGKTGTMSGGKGCMLIASHTTLSSEKIGFCPLG